MEEGSEEDERRRPSMKGGDVNNVVEAEKRSSMEQGRSQGTSNQNIVEGKKERGPRMKRWGEGRRGPRMKRTWRS